MTGRSCSRNSNKSALHYNVQTVSVSKEQQQQQQQQQQKQQRRANVTPLCTTTCLRTVQINTRRETADAAAVFFSFSLSFSSPIVPIFFPRLAFDRRSHVLYVAADDDDDDDIVRHQPLNETKQNVAAPLVVVVVAAVVVADDDDEKDTRLGTGRDIHHLKLRTLSLVQLFQLRLSAANHVP